ncbi:Ionotropic receptor 135 [Frankliniella occidentalis]|nr:Ionotropic receptor 135 [Frankliniella occidentalis]
MELLAIVALLIFLTGYDAVLPEPRPSLDAQGVADLVSSFVSGSKIGVCINGENHALDVFTRQLPPETARILSRNLTANLEHRLRLPTTDNLLLITAESPSLLADLVASTWTPGLSRVLLWTWAPSAPSTEGVLALGVATPRWLFQKQAALAVSTPGGATSLFALRSGLDRNSREESVNVTEIDRWSPRARRWLRQASPFTKVCTAWRSSEPPPRRVLAIRPHAYVAHPEAYTNFINYFVSRLGVRVDWRDEDRGLYKELEGNAFNCTLSAVFGFRYYPMVARASISFADVRLVPLQVVVPVGLDPHASLLQAVTDEFSAELWYATIAAVLGVAMVTVLATVAVLGRPVVVALATAPLQTLAPLLGQGPPGRTAHRPLSAVWLLMSVVLVAAYQGLLLRELTTPPGDINSLEQLEKSGLDIRITYDLYSFANQFLSDTLRSRTTFVSSGDLGSAVRMAAEERNIAVFLQKDINSHILTSSYVASKPPKVHTFVVCASFLSAKVVLTTGSPLQTPIERSTGWSAQHGLYRRMIKELGIRNRVHKEAEDGGREQLTRALSLDQLRPAFLLLAYCYGVSAIVFVCEIIYHKWSQGQGGN